MNQETIEHKYKKLLEESELWQLEREELILKYEELHQETNENTIIQSMRDMKEQYEELQLLTVSKYKYENIVEKYLNLKRTCEAVLVLVNHSHNILLKRERGLFNESILKRIDSSLTVIHDVLNEILK